METHISQELWEPTLAASQSGGNLDRLSSGARLQMITSILAMAVLRKKARKTMNYDGLADAEGSSPACGEGLDLSRKQSVHAGQTRPETMIKS